MFLLLVLYLKLVYCHTILFNIRTQNDEGKQVLYQGYGPGIVQNYFFEGCDTSEISLD